MTNAIFVGVVVFIFLLLLGFIILYEGCDITSFGELKDSITESKYKKHFKKFERAKEKKMFFKQVRCFKKVLNNKSCADLFEKELIRFKKCDAFSWETDCFGPMWELAVHRQLFSIKEQKVIDDIDNEIKKVLLEREERLKKERKKQEELRQRAQNSKQNVK